MFNFLLKQTDNFICVGVKNIFEGLETNYKNKDIKVDLNQELKSLEFDPFVRIRQKGSAFEKSVKLKLTSVIGTFFVLIPLAIMLYASYSMNIPYAYSFILTFVVAIFAAYRTNKVTTRYSNFRHSLGLGLC